MSAPEPARETFPAFIARHGVKFEFEHKGDSRMTGGRLYSVRGYCADRLAGSAHPERHTRNLPDYNGSQHDAETGKAPDPADYLSCLVTDASFADSSLDELFEDLGLSKPSEALAMLAGCKMARRALRELLGADAVAELDGLEGW